MSYAAPKEKRKRNWSWPILILILILAAGGLGLKFGIIPGGEKVFGEDGVTYILGNDPGAPPPEAKTGDEHQLVISETTITLDDKVLTLQELETELTGIPEIDTFVIQEKNAIKETYEQVIAIMDRLQKKYSTVQ